MTPPGAGFVPKGWGWEKVVVNFPKYCGKVMAVAAGRRCSWHYHQEKEETFYVASGRLRLSWMKREVYEELTGLGWRPEEILRHDKAANSAVLEQGASFHLIPGTLHQFEGLTDAVIVEFSTEHRDEDSLRVIHGD